MEVRRSSTQTSSAPTRFGEVRHDGTEKEQRTAAEIALSFAELKSGLRETMRRTRLEEQIGSDRCCESIEECVQAFLERQQGGAG